MTLPLPRPAADPLRLAGHHVCRSLPLPPFAGPLVEYWLAGNGLWLRAVRPGLAALIPLGPPVAVRGLPPLTPRVQVGDPAAADGRVPTALLAIVLAAARAARTPAGAWREHLAYLSWALGPAGGGRLTFPPQEAGPTHVRPTETGPGSAFATALLEIHSHHVLPPFWSATDDADEAAGFRLYGVLGHLATQPRLRLRVGIYGTFWEVDPATVAHLPTALAAPLAAPAPAPAHRPWLRRWARPSWGRQTGASNG